MSNDIQFQFSSPEQSPGFLLWQVTMLWQRQIKKVLDPLDLTHTQFVLLATLAWLQKSQNAITQTAIADHSRTDRMMVSKVLRTLEEKQLLARAEHTHDPRAKSVRLTENGEILLQKALQAVESADIQFFSPVSGYSATMEEHMLHLLKDAAP